MSRRSLTLAVAGVATLAAILVAVLVPVPYVILTPGPTLNTLGKDSTGHELISISGAKTYPATGHLNMVTISYTGGPGSDLNVFQALKAWLDPSDAVVPEAELFPAGQTAQQTQAQDTEQMASSQQQATAAALSYLHVSYRDLVQVVSTVAGYPARSVLRAGDVIQAVNGQAVTGPDALSSIITGKPAGTVFQVKVLRSGQARTLPVASKASDGTPVIGVNVQQRYQFPFTVQITVGDIGGPSAGTMFALGIIDKLTADNLTDGKFIAGTGEITASGQVGAIGGIQQKMVAARAAGATVFLAPAGNCADVRGAVPQGLRVVQIATLSQAVTRLQALKAGHPVPSC